MRKKQKILSQAKIIYGNALKETEEEIVILEDEISLRISRVEAEKMYDFLEKCELVKNLHEFKDIVLEQYDNIPYIIGATTKTAVGQVQEMIEEIINCQ